MATPQPPMGAGGPRPQPGQGPPQGMVLQHAHGQPAQLVPMMQNAAHFAPQAPNYAAQIPLQHQRQPMMNGIPGAHPNYNIQNNQQAMAAARQQQHIRQLQGGMVPGTAIAQGPFQQQMQHMHPQQLQQLQAQFQQNPALRLNPQHQLIPQQHLMHQQAMAGPAVQHMQGQQNPIQLIPAQRGNMPLQRFAQFACQLSSIVPGKTKEGHWRKFVQDWFVQQATVRLVLGEGQQGRKEFELPNSLIHHFFHTIHTSGVRQMHMMLGAPQAESGPHVLECPGASILYRFESGTQVVWDGSLKVQFKAAGNELKIERLEIVSDEYTEFFPLKPAKQTLTPPLSNRSTSPEAKRSPMERNMLSQMGDVRSGSDHGEISSPRTDVNEMGVPRLLMRFLEIAEIFVYICPLIDFSQNKEVSPQQALQAFSTNHPQPGKQIQQQFHSNQQGNFIHPAQASQLASPMNDMSPLTSHTNLPVQGITNSPQPHQYPSPMSSQTSQTGATGPNTTPLISHRQAPSSAAPKPPQGNKRRRASAVQTMTMKEEDEEPMGNPTAKHPKQSPRTGTGRGGGPGGPPGKRLRSDG